MMDSETAKTIAPFITPLVQSAVSVWLTPKLEQITKKLSRKSRFDGTIVEVRFSEYLKRSYEKHMFMTTLVFQNQRKELLDLYIPLSIEETNSKGNSPIVIDDFVEELFTASNKVLITDTVGMGKSTCLKFLFIKSIQKNIGLPVFIELRRLSAERSVLSLLSEELSSIKNEVGVELIQDLIENGDFIFYLDGFDEIPFADRSTVIDQLHDFISKSNNNKFILTSRPETALSSFPDFQGYKINGLTKQQAFQLISKYSEENDLGAELIKKLQKNDKKLDGITAFLGNPLLVSLLYKSYSYKQTIPNNKHLFYRQVYDAIFENHDLSKAGGYLREKNSGLNIDDFHRMLRILGYKSMQRGIIEYDKDTLLKLIRDCKVLCPGLQFAEDSFLKDLITSVPLFSCEAMFYRWAHKSIMEYFAAQYICIDAKDRQESILLNLYNSINSSNYVNVLDLCYDIDYKTFRYSVVKEFLIDYLNYFDTAYPSSSYLKSGIGQDLLDSRKKVSFMGEFVFIPREKFGNGKSKGFSDKRSFSDLDKYINSHFKDFKRSISVDGGRGYVLAVAYNKYYWMANLLFSKNELFMIEIKGRSLPSDHKLSISNTLKVDDTTENECNTSEKFKAVTSILRSYIPHDIVEIDYKVAKLTLEQIQREIQEIDRLEKESDVF